MKFHHLLLRSSLQLLKWHHLLPHNRWGDAWFARLHCLRYNGHWPRAVGGSLEDFLAFMKGSTEVEHPLRKQYSDKYLAKELARQRLGPAGAVSTWGYLTSDQEIEGFAFPARCVIKPTHLSGEIMFRSNGEAINLDLIKAWLRQDHYRKTRERNYRGVKPGVLIEPWLEFVAGREYRVYCLRGEPQMITVWFPEGRRGSFDPQGQPLNYTVATLSAPFDPEIDLVGLAQTFPLLLEAARKLSAGLVFARVDLYHTASGVCLGELTTTPFGGVVPVHPSSLASQFACDLFGLAGFCLADFPELRPATVTASA